MAGPDLRSRIVAVLKVGLPLIAVGLISALFLIKTDDSLGGGEIRFSEGDMAALGSGLRVSNPTLTGTTEGNDRFRFTADLVVPDAAPPKRASMTRLAGEMELARGLTIDLAAPTAELDIPKQRLSLAGTVRVSTSDGFDLMAAKMTLDLGAGVLEASDKVETTGPMGRIESGSLRIAPKDKDKAETARLISFGNGVRLIYDPPKRPPEPKDE